MVGGQDTFLSEPRYVTYIHRRPGREPVALSMVDPFWRYKFFSAIWASLFSSHLPHLCRVWTISLHSAALQGLG